VIQQHPTVVNDVRRGHERGQGEKQQIGRRDGRRALDGR